MLLNHNFRWDGELLWIYNWLGWYMVIVTFLLFSLLFYFAFYFVTCAPCMQCLNGEKILSKWMVFDYSQRPTTQYEYINISKDPMNSYSFLNSINQAEHELNITFIIAIFLMKYFVVSYYHFFVSFYLALSHIYRISTKLKQWKEDKLTKETEKNCQLHTILNRLWFSFFFFFFLWCALFFLARFVFYDTAAAADFMAVACRYFNKKKPFFIIYNNF